MLKKIIIIISIGSLNINAFENNLLFKIDLNKNYSIKENELKEKPVEEVPKDEEPIEEEPIEDLPPAFAMCGITFSNLNASKEINTIALSGLNFIKSDGTNFDFGNVITNNPSEVILNNGSLKGNSNGHGGSGYAVHALAKYGSNDSPWYFDSPYKTSEDIRNYTGTENGVFEVKFNEIQQISLIKIKDLFLNLSNGNQVLRGLNPVYNISINDCSGNSIKNIQVYENISPSPDNTGSLDPNVNQFGVPKPIISLPSENVCKIRFYNLTDIGNTAGVSFDNLQIIKGDGEYFYFGTLDSSSLTSATFRFATITSGEAISSTYPIQNSIVQYYCDPKYCQYNPQPFNDSQLHHWIAKNSTTSFTIDLKKLIPINSLRYTDRIYKYDFGNFERGIKAPYTIDLLNCNNSLIRTINVNSNVSPANDTQGILNLK